MKIRKKNNRSSLIKKSRKGSKKKGSPKNKKC